MRDTRGTAFRIGGNPSLDLGHAHVVVQGDFLQGASTACGCDRPQRGPFDSGKGCEDRAGGRFRIDTCQMRQRHFQIGKRPDTRRDENAMPSDDSRSRDAIIETYGCRNFAFQDIGDRHKPAGADAGQLRSGPTHEGSVKIAFTVSLYQGFDLR
ncbi:hypothetical protein D3C71_360620 [compost metagenome]